ncbi:hypothetical protein [Dyadobacter diqingensis]|uniref:hypothetical protein n=1 Tax=Dyadobacter diqingensis TaxID=2938121 RepID=UPI0020C1B457|nr:hypothetical protein [Dyadobacter diqingensis]
MPHLKTSQLTKSRIAAIGKFLLVGLVFVIPGYFFLYPQVFYCQVIDFSNFEKIKTNIYASPDLDARQRVHMIRVIKKAEARVDSFWSGKQASPKVILCGTSEEYEKYCQSTEGAGCSLGTPWGQSFVILNAQGLNADVISHEMSHVEIFKRLGWWKTTTEIPQWFNEGTALMLDKRFVSNPDSIGRYLEYTDEWLYQTGGGQNILELENISSVKGFFSGNQKQVMLAYMTSGMEVSYWLAYVGNNGLLKLLSEMKNGHSFNESYLEIEKEARERSKIKLPANPLRVADLNKIHE